MDSVSSPPHNHKYRLGGAILALIPITIFLGAVKTGSGAKNSIVGILSMQMGTKTGERVGVL